MVYAIQLMDVTGRSQVLRIIGSAVVGVVASVASAAAQTVFVRSAPQGSSVELMLNAARVDAATADPSGGATLRVGAAARTKGDTDVHILVHSCGAVRRVLLVESGEPQPPQGSCDERALPDLFLMGRETTFVIDIGGPVPRVRVRQGEAPASWLVAPGPDGKTPSVLRTASNGLIVSGGGGVTRLSEAEAVACGNIGGCDGPGLPWTAAASVGYWPSRFFGVEAGYMRPFDAKVSSAGPPQFTSTLDLRMLTLVGKVGTQAGSVRLYAMGGVNRHNLTFSTTQAFGDTGSLTVAFKTEGWGLLVGGGGESWVTPALGIYVEGGWTKLNGKAADESGGAYDDRMLFGIVGLRLRILK